MWTCSMLKENARNALRRRYWPVLAVCLLASILGGTTALSAPVNLQITLNNWIEDATAPQVWTGNYPQPSELEYLAYYISVTGLWVVIAVTIVAVMVAATLFDVFLGGPARVGLCRYLMESRQGSSPLATLFTVFRTPYLNVVKVQFLTNLKIALGTLLFVVPGVIWSYRYCLVPYLLAENPYLSTHRAMELSRQMMHGEKLHAFGLQLSFLGWKLLVVLTLGWGGIFLQPYLEATHAELYAAMRSKALAYGYADESELGGFVYHEDPRRG